MTGICEQWEPVVDESVPALSRYDVSNLGRVRSPSGKILKPSNSSIRRGKPQVRLYAHSRKHFRTVRGLVSSVYGPISAELAVLSIIGGLEALLTERDRHLEFLEVIDQFVSLVLSEEGQKPIPEGMSVRDFALQEAHVLGKVLRGYTGTSGLEDPITGMTREEKLSRLACLRHTFGSEIERAAGLDSETVSRLIRAS